MAKRKAATTFFYPDGARVSWLDVYNPDPAQRIWRLGTVWFRCCEASVPAGLYQVIDEVGEGHLSHAAELRPRADGPDYAPRPPGPRKGETT